MQGKHFVRRWLGNLVTLLFAALPISGAAQEFRSYYVNDVVGSPVLSSDSHANVRWSEDYRPYGERVIHASSASNDGDNQRWFTGADHNDVTGLSYFGSRHYDPVVGRFLSIDPVGLSPGDASNFNRYAYANNNPYKFVDTNGQLPIIPIIVGVAWVADKAFAAYEARQDYKAIKAGETTIGEVAMRRGGEHVAGQVAGPVGRWMVKGGKKIWVRMADLGPDAWRSGVRLSDDAKAQLRHEARALWEKKNGRAAGALQIHHRIPLEYAHLFPNADPNRFSNLIGLEPGIHSQIHANAWDAFRRQLGGRTPSQAEVMGVAMSIDKAFADEMAKAMRR
jgi:RHS repeat-associated protein